MSEQAPDLGAQMIRWGERHLKVTQGEHLGEPFTFMPWQREFVLEFLAPDVRTGALSVARGNGKSGLAAAIASGAINGPLRQPRGLTAIVASSFEQARGAIFEDVLAGLGDYLKSKQTWRVRDQQNMAAIKHNYSRAELRVFGSDPRRLMGLRPSLVIWDEPSESLHPERVLAALMTALGKLPGARLLAIGTRPADDHHVFARLLQDADVTACYSGDPAAPLTEENMRAANPSWDHFATLRQTILAEAEIAKQDSQQRRQFDAYRLNAPSGELGRSMLLDSDSLQAIEVDRGELPEPEGGYVLALDLSSGYAMSAAAAVWPETMAADYLAAFPAKPSLAARGERDSVGGDYQVMAQDGDLLVLGDRTVDLDLFLAECVKRWGEPEIIIGDRWRANELLDSMERIGLQPDQFDTRGQGFKDQGADVSDFRLAAVSRQLKVRRSFALRHAFAATETALDPAGNEKIVKHKNQTRGGSKKGARDDLAVAMVMAVAAAVRINRGGQPEYSMAGHEGVIR